MTKQDVDNIISVLCPNDEDFEKPIISPAYLKKELEALALEQEPCDDCINRKALTDTTICEGISCNECSFNTCEDGQSGCLLNERVSKLPSITPIQRWIPVSERLPKNGYYLWCARGGEIQKDYYWYGHWSIAEDYGYEVIAWMPLPQPYKESEVKK